MRRIATTIAGLALASALNAWPVDAEEVSGNAVLGEVHLAEGAVVLDGDRYTVSDTTRLENEQGGDLTLAELPSLAGGASADEAAVWFEADEPTRDGTRRLRHLRLTGAVPR
ncbi:MAG: hypothetical protein OZ948_02945 [Deltaproteobacteria bacterium]|nr:hypothetical protein [Deltaproteobacteria bacterium]